MAGGFCSSNTAETTPQMECNLSQEQKALTSITLYWYLGDANSRAIKALLAQ